MKIDRSRFSPGYFTVSGSIFHRGHKYCLGKHNKVVKAVYIRVLGLAGAVAGAVSVVLRLTLGSLNVAIKVMNHRTGGNVTKQEVEHAKESWRESLGQVGAIVEGFIAFVKGDMPKDSLFSVNYADHSYTTYYSEYQSGIADVMNHETAQIINDLVIPTLQNPDMPLGSRFDNTTLEEALWRGKDSLIIPLLRQGTTPTAKTLLITSIQRGRESELTPSQYKERYEDREDREMSHREINQLILDYIVENHPNPLDAIAKLKGEIEKAGKDLIKNKPYSYAYSASFKPVQDHLEEVYTKLMSEKQMKERDAMLFQKEREIKIIKAEQEGLEGLGINILAEARSYEKTIQYKVILDKSKLVLEKQDIPSKVREEIVMIRELIEQDKKNNDPENPFYFERLNEICSNYLE